TKTIALVTGCFEILHAGHLAVSECVGKAADAVIVAVNSDSYLRRTKGRQVTIVDEDARALLIASLQYTDPVIIFDEDTPEKLIELIDPNVLVMGQEYEQQYMDKMLP